MVEKSIEGWDELIQEHGKLKKEADRSRRRWLYRGEGVWGRKLRPTLERELLRFRRPLSEMRETEQRLLREFKRHYHRYSDAPPHSNDLFRWLALIQHHGGPTRLLDFTYSFYAGVFFALRKAGPSCDATLWLLDHDGLWELIRSQLPPELLDAVEENPDGWKGLEVARMLLNTDRHGVMPVNPLDLDARLAVQQGVLLMPLDLSQSFQTVFLDQIGGENEHLAQKWHIKLNLAEIRTALSELQRMNLNELTLFPGVDGLARNLCNMVGLPHLFVREDMKPTDYGW